MTTLLHHQQKFDQSTVVPEIPTSSTLTLALSFARQLSLTGRVHSNALMVTRHRAQPSAIWGHGTTRLASVRRLFFLCDPTIVCRIIALRYVFSGQVIPAAKCLLSSSVTPTRRIAFTPNTPRLVMLSVSRVTMRRVLQRVTGANGLSRRAMVRFWLSL